MPLVEVSLKKLIFRGSTEPVLQNINLSIEEGEYVILTGPVASGKSVLCHCLTGAVPHFFPAYMEGQVTIGGMDLSVTPLPQIAGKVGYMMQDPQNQICNTTVAEDVAFGPGNLGLSKKEVQERVAASLEFVALSGMDDRAPETLSGGEAQRAVLAGVIALNPGVLVLDQPTAELDPSGRRQIYERLFKLNNERRTTIVMVADCPDEVLRYASRLLVMEEGTIISDTQIPKVDICSLNHPLNQKKKLVVNSDSVGSGKLREREVLAYLANCTYEYPDGRRGCREVSLKLYRGELTALLGLNGSGKTTVAKHFNGLLRPVSGRVNVLGQELTKSNINLIRQKVGFLFQNPDYQIFANTVEEEAGFTLKMRKVSPEEITQRVSDVLAVMGLEAYRKQHPHRLSRGQRQLLALASIMVGNPDIIIADEPTAGLDRTQATVIIEQLAQMAENGCSVLVVTHDLQIAAHYAQRIVMMHEQSIGFDLTPVDLPEYRNQLHDMGFDFSSIAG